MGRASKYKWEAGDKVGLYEVIKVLPSEPHVKNLVIYASCLLCGEKVKRFSNRMESKHRGCTAEVKVEKTDEPIEPVVFNPLPHTKANGLPADQVLEEAEELVADANPLPETDEDSEDFVLPEDTNLPDEVKNALNFDVDAQAVYMVRLADKLDISSKFLFMTTFKRYLTLVHLARRLEKKIAETGELTVIGSTGNQIANPLIREYKSVSSESTSHAKQLMTILAKTAGDGEEDPLAKLFAGGE